MPRPVHTGGPMPSSGPMPANGPMPVRAPNATEDRCAAVSATGSADDRGRAHRRTLSDPPVPVDAPLGVRPPPPLPGVGGWCRAAELDGSAVPTTPPRIGGATMLLPPPPIWSSSHPLAMSHPLSAGRASVGGSRPPSYERGMFEPAQPAPRSPSYERGMFERGSDNRPPSCGATPVPLMRGDTSSPDGRSSYDTSLHSSVRGSLDSALHPMGATGMSGIGGGFGGMSGGMCASVMGGAGMGGSAGMGGGGGLGLGTMHPSHPRVASLGGATPFQQQQPPAHFRDFTPVDFRPVEDSTYLASAAFNPAAPPAPISLPLHSSRAGWAGSPSPTSSSAWGPDLPNSLGAPSPSAVSLQQMQAEMRAQQQIHQQQLQQQQQQFQQQLQLQQQVHHQQLQLQQQRERHEKQLKQQQEAMQPPGSRLPSFDPHGSRPGSYDPHASRPGSYDPHANRPGSYDPHGNRPSSYDAHASRPGSYDPHGNRPGSYDPHANRPGSYDPHANRPGSYDPHGNRPGSFEPHANRPGSYNPHASRPGSYDPHARPPSYERGMGMGGVPNSSGGGGMMGGISGSLGGVGLVGGTGLRVSLDAGQGGSLASSATSLTTGSDASARQSKELMMSPKTRAVYKAFSHRLRSKETQGRGMAHASELARRCLAELPSTVHWRVHLEMADLAKREKSFGEARRLYRRATIEMPTAAQTWLEYAKMEEERGHFERCHKILTAGLHYCPYHEALMLKAIKHLERMGKLDKARALLGKLAPVPISQCWRTVLEGALLEARASQTATARRIFKFLLQQAPWYGPVWHEACRFEQRCSHLHEALRIAELGLNQLPRYGPLWFSALRLYESTSTPQELLRATRALVDRGVKHISKDLVWKLWFECAQLEERNGHLQRARAAYVRSVANCAPNLRWKVWLGGARTELTHGQFEAAHALLERAHAESPPKTRALVMLEQSRLHELCGNIDTARKLLKGARRTNGQEWKVFLEAVQLEVRCQALPRALREARKALDVHRGTGRLWAVLIQLEHSNGVERQLAVFQQALLEVPKSGEVWCEGARICLNPYSSCFNLAAAKNFLEFAIEFTPQYGDSFIEYLRLQMLTRAAEAQVERLWQLCINAEPNYGTLWFHCKASPLLSTRQVLGAASDLIGNELMEWQHVYQTAMRRHDSPAFRAIAAEAVAAVLRSTEALPKLELPLLEVSGGAPSEPADFVTGSVGLNRMQRRCPELSMEVQRRLIYGGDMIVP